jgi:L-threonylcarbamoyladenylate synthase
MNLKKALHIIKSGGVIAHATETCYGFACNAFDKKALNRLYRIKQMDRRKPVSIMVSGLKMAKKYGIFSKKSQALAKKYWPGPLTIIVKRRKPLPHFLNPHTKTIGFRVPTCKMININRTRLLLGG